MNGKKTLIKKYANRRLYNTAISQYIRLDDVAEMVQNSEEFKVVEAKTGKDITRSVLAQIIVDEEAKGESVLPINFLREVINMYNNTMRPFLPQYLEHMMKGFTENQEQWKQTLNTMSGGFVNNEKGVDYQSMTSAVEDMARRNLEMMDKTMRAFNPFFTIASGQSVPQTATESTNKKREIETLKRQMQIIHNRLEELNKSS